MFFDWSAHVGAERKKKVNHTIIVWGLLKFLKIHADFCWVISSFLRRWFWLFSFWTMNFKPVAGMKGINLGFQPSFRGKELIVCYPYFLFNLYCYFRISWILSQALHMLMRHDLHRVVAFLIGLHATGRIHTELGSMGSNICCFLIPLD